MLAYKSSMNRGLPSEGNLGGLSILIASLKTQTPEYSIRARLSVDLDRIASETQQQVKSTICTFVVTKEAQKTESKTQEKKRKHPPSAQKRPRPSPPSPHYCTVSHHAVSTSQARYLLS
jgi:hypothetical protein